jgi:hypothetical protein
MQALRIDPVGGDELEIGHPHSMGETVAYAFGAIRRAGCTTWLAPRRAQEGAALIAGRTMTAVSATVTRSMGEAARASPHLLERCVDHAVAELQAAEQNALKGDERRDCADAWRELLTQRARWAVRFPQLLQAAFNAAASGEGTGGEKSAPTLRPSSLTLVGENEIDEKIEASRLAQQLTSTLERPLAELDALMSSALGLDVVQPERNPLRPEIYARTLRQLLGEAKGEAGWPALWLRHMASPLAKELEQLYRDQAHLLTLARVQAAGYRLRGTPSRAAPLLPADGGMPSAQRGGAPSGFQGLGPAQGESQHSAHGALAGGPASRSGALHPASGAGTPAPANEGMQLGDFLRRGLPAGGQELQPSYYAAIEAEIAAIEAETPNASYDAAQARQYVHLPPVERPPRHVGTDSPLPQETWGNMAQPRERALVRGRLKQQARELGQVYALEVVRKLVDEVAQDPRLLAPVREAIVGLEPSLLRLSLVAPRFFSDEQHPGRRLIERVAERSFAFNDEFSVAFRAFLGPVVHSFRRLNDFDSFDGVGPFRLALATLEAGWAAQDALDAEAQRKVLRAVEFAEQRQREADGIAGELAQRSDLADVPEAMRDFVLRRWSLVVAHARLSDPQHGIDPGGYLALVTDLLFSVNRERALHEPARAFALIPQVLTKLRAGLAMLGEPPGDSDGFFQLLERLHRPVLKLRAKQRQGEMPAADRNPAPLAPQPPARGPDQLWMGEAELRAAGFEDTRPSAHGELTAVHGDVILPDEPLGDAEAEQLIAALAVNGWVDLFSHQQWHRARLVWTSGNGAFYMFTSQGNRPHSMTRRSLQRLLRGRLLRLVESDAVVPRALATLAGQRLPFGHAVAAPALAAVH